jgi:hypothetical protein
MRAWAHERSHDAGAAVDPRARPALSPYFRVWHRPRVRLLLAAPILASLLAGGDAAVEDRFLGRIEGTHALVAAVASADAAVFCACGGRAGLG